MPFTADALAKIKHLRPSSPATPEIVPKFPDIFSPAIQRRFTETEKAAADKVHEDIERWRVATNLAITGGATA